jgi:protein TilB
MPRRRPFRPEFPDLDGADDQQQPLNCNEGEWDYGLEEQEDGSNGSRSYLLTLHLQREILLDDIKLDLREKLVRILAAGCLFQIRLPEVVKSDAARASRSRATGKLRITMPIDQKGP